MGELFGVLVISASALTLFALATIQVAHRVVGGHVAAQASVLVLPELDDIPFRIVVSFAAAIAAGSQIPVLYLLARSGDLSAASAALLSLELVAAMAWAAELAGARHALRHLYQRYAVRRSLAS